MPDAPLTPDEVKAAEELAGAQRQLAWELTRLGVNTASIVDPTGATNVVDLGMAIYDKDFIGAGLDLIALIPVAGKLANLAKEGKAAKRIAALKDLVAGLTASLGKLRKLRAEAKAADEAVLLGKTASEIKDAQIAEKTAQTLESAEKSGANAAPKACKACEKAAAEKAAAYQKLPQQDKKLLSEAIGEDAMHDMATAGKPDGLGYESVLSPSQASKRPQGFDGVYRDPTDGALIIGEAKGGYNNVVNPKDTLGTGYGYRQGTIGWAKAAAKRTIRAADRAANKVAKNLKAGQISEAASADQLARIQRERDVANQVLTAIETGKPPVRVEVFHTPHEAGVPLGTTHAVVGQTKPR